MSEFAKSMRVHTRILLINRDMPTIKVRKYADSVYIIYSHQDKIFKIFTGVKVQDKYWNKTTPKKNCPYFKNVVTQIDAMEARVLNVSMTVRARGEDPIIDLVRKEFYAQLSETKEKPHFWDVYKEYLSLLTCKESSKKKIGMTYKVLNFFCAWSGYKFEIETFDKAVFGRFVQYLIVNQHMADSTINRHVRMLKTFLKFAYPLRDISWMKYSLLPVEEEVIALTEEELKYLIDENLSGYLDKARDLFVFMATTGMRHCDSQLFNSTWVSEERILEFTQLKTGSKAYPPLYEVSRGNTAEV